MKYQFKYRALAESLYESLAADPFYGVLENSILGNAFTKREGMLMFMDYSMDEAKTYGELFIPDNFIGGASIWSKPLNRIQESKKKAFKSSFLLQSLGQTSLETYSSIVDFMSSKSSNLIKTDAYYLSIIGLKPNLQGKGLGSILVNKVLEQTDKLKISTYLETFTQRNISFYERLGYSAIASFNEPTVSHIYWIMKREPN